MRVSEPITIYLAAGASFGVSRYQLALEKSCASKRRALIEGIAAAMLWPLAAAAILFKRLRQRNEGSATEKLDARAAARVEQTERALVVSINKMLAAVRSSHLTKREEMERTLYTLRESAEQYVGLSGVKDEDAKGAAPLKHEMELARISGRRGDDLLIAGLCAHRRNRARTVARYERSRSSLLRALARLRAEEEGKTFPSYDKDEDGDERRKMSEARLDIYERASELFSLTKDRDAARSAAHLLDAESACLKSLQKLSGDDKEQSALGEERCIEQSTQLIYKDRRMETTFTQG